MNIFLQLLVEVVWGGGGGLFGEGSGLYLSLSDIQLQAFSNDISVTRVI